MLLSRLANMAFRIPTHPAFTPALLARGRATTQFHAQSLPSAGARRALTVRAGVICLSLGAGTGTSITGDHAVNSNMFFYVPLIDRDKSVAGADNV